MSFWGELKRRDVFKVAIAYLVASWLIVQVIGVLTEPLRLPDVLDTVVVVLLAIGFPFALIIAWVYEVTPEGLKVTGERNAAQPTGRKSARLTHVVIGMLAVAVGLVAVDRFVATPSSREFGPGSRLAVLPCDDLNPDPSSSFFSVGIHDELLTRLQSLSELRVISRTSVMQYAGRRPPVPEIAVALNVDAIIECGTRYAGDRVYLTAQLIDAATDTHLWADSFTGTMSNPESLFRIQAEIATGVADALHVEFFAGERERIESVPTVDPQAYDAYLRGRAAALQFENADAVASLERAVSIDPEFGLAWVALAAAYGPAEFASPERRDELRSLARNARQRALATAPDRWEPHALRATELASQRDWIAAAREMEVARGLSPTSPVDWALMYGGGFLAQVGKLEEGAALYEAARSADPASTTVSAQTAWALDLAGRNEEALREFDRHWALGGNVIWSAQDLQASLVLGDPVRIQSVLERLAAGSPMFSQLASIWQSPEAAKAFLRAELLDSAGPTNATILSAWAVIAAYYRDTDLVLDMLRKAYMDTDAAPVNLWHPLMRDVRMTSGFKNLVVELGLPGYWRAYGWPDHCRPAGGNDFSCD